MSFLSDVKAVEARVKTAMEDGPVTPYYSLPLEQVYDVLNAALASELVCVLRYQQHYYMTTSIHQSTLQALFKEHWEDEQGHLEAIADRIKQLGGVPNLDPEGSTKRGFSSFKSGHTLAELLREDLLAERVVVKMYGDIVTSSARPIRSAGACSKSCSRTKKIMRTRSQTCFTPSIRKRVRRSSSLPATRRLRNSRRRSNAKRYDVALLIDAMAASSPWVFPASKLPLACHSTVPSGFTRKTAI